MSHVGLTVRPTVKHMLLMERLEEYQYRYKHITCSKIFLLTKYDFRTYL